MLESRVNFLAITKGKVTKVLAVAKEEETVFGHFGIFVTLYILLWIGRSLEEAQRPQDGKEINLQMSLRSKENFSFKNVSGTFCSL